MKKNSKIILTAAALVVLIAGGVGLYYASSPKTADTVKTQTASSDAKVEFANNGQEVSYVGQDGKTALDVLKSLTNVDTKESTYGTMVVGIHGVKAEEGKNYWSFYVNGAYANEGAGTYKTKSTEAITWKLEAITQ